MIDTLDLRTSSGTCAFEFGCAYQRVSPKKWCKIEESHEVPFVKVSAKPLSQK